MRSLRCEQFGPPSQLKLQELPEPLLINDQALVEVHAAAVNPSDVKNVLGNMAHSTLPRTPGRDFAGVVVDGPEKLLGLEVWGTGGEIGFTQDGSHASHIVLPQAAVRPKPGNLSMELAGTVGVTYVTAWLCLMDAAHLSVGETVLVIGATGGVGSAAVQIAKWQGARVIGTVRRDADAAQVRNLGADAVINLAEQDLREAIPTTLGHCADVIIDTVGGVMVEACLGALAPRGRLTEISAPAAERRISFDLIDFYRRQARLLGVDSRAVDATGCATILEALTPGFESGALAPAPETECYVLKDGVTAYEQVRDRKTTRKVVLTPQM